MLTYCRLDPQEQTSVKFYSKFKRFHEENTFEDVVQKMAAILSRPHFVNRVNTEHLIAYVGKVFIL